jgi:hypothetical protein
MEVSGQLHASVALPTALIGLEAGWAPESVWTMWNTEKSLSPAGNQTNQIIISPLVHAHSSLPPEMCYRSDQAAHYHIFGL